MASRRRAAPERAWLVNQGRSGWVFTNGVTAGDANVLIAGADLVNAPGITLADVKSDYFCTRLIFNAWFELTAVDDDISHPSRRMLQCMLLTGDLADQQEWATALGDVANCNMWDTDSSFWTSSRRILQQEHIPLYMLPAFPALQAQAAPVAGSTPLGALYQHDAPSNWGPSRWSLDISSRWSLDEDSDLVFVTAAPLAQFDPSWADGEALTFRWDFKALFQMRRGA